MNLELAVARELGAQPVDCGERVAPLVGEDLTFVGKVAPADHVDDGLAQHAGRSVDQDEDPLTAELQAGQVLALAVTDERA